MATLRLDNATISIGGADLTSFASSIELPIADPAPESARPFGAPSGPIRFCGNHDGLAGQWPRGLESASITVTMTVRPRDMRRYRAWWRSTRPQISRMRALYGRRRGRGRW